MILGTYAQSYAPTHKLILLSIEDGIGIFEETGGSCPGRVKCPVTPDFVIPYVDRTKIKEMVEKNEG